MLAREERDAVFLLACIPTRLLLATYAPDELLRPFATAVAVSWVTMRGKTHGFFGGRVYWASARPLHAALWFAYAVTSRRAFLFGDVLLGVLVWHKGR